MTLVAKYLIEQLKIINVTTIIFNGYKRQKLIDNVMSSFNLFSLIYRFIR